MTGRPSSPIVIVALLLAAVGGMALAAQDKYAVQVPGGLAFSEFRGYEDWQTVSVSQTEGALAVIPGLGELVRAVVHAAQFHFGSRHQRVAAQRIDVGADRILGSPLTIEKRRQLERGRRVIVESPGEPPIARLRIRRVRS